MTEAERQQVIDALETAMRKWAEWVDECRGVGPEGVMGEGDDWRKCTAALAIMRREREETTVQHVHQWFRTGEMEPGQIRCIECGAWGRER